MNVSQIEGRVSFIIKFDGISAALCQDAIQEVSLCSVDDQRQQRVTELTCRTETKWPSSHCIGGHGDPNPARDYQDEHFQCLYGPKSRV